MKIKGKALWASILAPNTRFEHQWEIDLVLDPSQVKGAEAAGLTVKNTEDGPVVRFKRKVLKRDGTENSPPVVVGADKQPITQLVGNGSTVLVQFHPWETTNKFGSFTGADLQAVQVLEHVLVEGARAPDGAEFEEVEVDAEPVKASNKKAAPKTEDFDDDLPDII